MLDNPYGIHLYNVPIAALTDHFLRLNLVFIVLWATSTLLVKATLLVLYLRIFRPALWMHWAIYTTIAVVSAFYLATVIADVVKCTPKPGGGGWLVSQQVCGPAALDIAVAQGVFGPVSDLVILLIPMVMVAPLKMERGRKVAGCYGFRDAAADGVLDCDDG